MKIPKYIEKLIDRRAKLAYELNSVDSELSDWLDNKDIAIEEYDYRTGCEMYCNPNTSADRIKLAILKS